MTMSVDRAPGSEDGWQVIDAGVRVARHLLGDDLVSAYAIAARAEEFAAAL